MKVYKFRTWDPMVRKMSYQDRDQWSVGIYNNKNDIWYGRYHSPGDIRLMQFTGLKDITGRDVYEGDLVLPSSADKNQVIRKVYWDDGASQFRLSSSGGDTQYDKTMMLTFVKICKVVGNVWENPELLEM